MQRAFGFAYQSPLLTPAPGATVNVFNNGTMVLATIFADNLSTPKSNPFTADAATAYWFFYGANGRYDVQISGSGFTTYTLGDYDLNDVFSLNGLTNSTQTLVVGNSGTDFNIVDTGPGTHTFNIPDASATARGLVTTGAQTIAGVKTFSTPIAVGSGGTGTGTAPTSGQTILGTAGGAYAVATIAGTANQVIVTPASGALTLSTPQSIGTASTPTFASVINSALAATQFGIPYVSDTLGSLAALPALTSGQVVIGSTGVAPVAATLTAGSNVTVTNAAGSITVAVPNVGITSLNGLTSAAAPAQTFATGNSGTSFNINSAGGAHTFNMPDASATADGTVSTGVQTLAGQKTFSTTPQYNPGGGSGTATLSGVLSAQNSVAGVANSGAAETTLFTFPLPASTLNALGKGVRVTAFGTVINNANAKTIKAYFGATSSASGNLANAAIGWIAIWEVYYVTNTTQTERLMINRDATGGTSFGTLSPVETLSGAVTIKVTGTGGATNDILANGLVVEPLGA